MNLSARLNAAAAYVPIVGWLYVYFLQREEPFARYHLRQSVGLVVFLFSVALIWGIVAWLLAWLPYMVALGIALFTIVLVAYLFGAFAWVIGVFNALLGRAVPLPGVGRWAARRMKL